MRFAAQGNVSTTGSESPVREAEKLNRQIGIDLLALLDLDARTTREAVSDKSVNEEIRDALRRHLSLSEQPRYLTREGQLTEIGVTLVEDMVLTQYLPVGIVERLRSPGNRKALLNTIESAIPTLNKIARASAEVPGATEIDLAPALVVSLDYLSRNPEVTLDAKGQLPENLDMFMDALAPELRMMTTALLKLGGKPRVFRDKLREFGFDMEGGLGMESRDPAEAFAERFDVTMQEGARFAPQAQPAPVPAPAQTPAALVETVPPPIAPVEQVPVETVPAIAPTLPFPAPAEQAPVPLPRAAQPMEFPIEFKVSKSWSDQ